MMLVPAKASRLFFSLQDDLLKYAKDVLHLTTSSKEQLLMNQMLFKGVVLGYWTHPENLDRFLKDNPDLSRNKRETAEGYKRNVTDLFVLMEHTPNGSYMVDRNDQVYLVKGLKSTMKEMTAYQQPPVTMMATLLPLCGDIVTDGLSILGEPEDKAEHIARARKAFQKAKETNQIIKTL